ncbi:MAG TPA: oxidoreductase [Anaeromyxobacteraceae bacterium]|nr:oxidoreductase [Anaeromyxobacteraceae bacterium]
MTGPSQHQRVPVLDAWDETAALRAVRVDLGGLSESHRGPGQVVKIRTPAGEGYFALASAPSPDRHADLLFRRGGPIADAAVAAAGQGGPGGALELTAPFGNGFPVAEAEGRDALLFAAGAGIAPIRSLVQHLIGRRERFGRVTLFYGQRRGADFAYRREHPDWERSGVRVVLCPSREDDAWQGVRGYVQEVARSLAFGGSSPGDSVAFVTGMHAMVDDVRAVLGRAGVPPARIHLNL